MDVQECEIASEYDPVRWFFDLSDDADLETSYAWLIAVRKYMSNQLRRSIIPEMRACHYWNFEFLFRWGRHLAALWCLTQWLRLIRVPVWSQSRIRRFRSGRGEEAL